MRMPDHIQAAYNEAAKLGATFEWAITNGNHIVGIIGLYGKTKRTYFAKTPSDCNAKWDAKRNVRTAMRQLGGM